MKTIAILILSCMLPLAAVQADEDAQLWREGFIARMMERGAIQGHSLSEGVVTMVVGEPYLNSDRDTQADIARIVYLFYLEQDAEMQLVRVILSDGTQLAVFNECPKARTPITLTGLAS